MLHTCAPPAARAAALPRHTPQALRHLTPHISHTSHTSLFRLLARLLAHVPVPVHAGPVSAHDVGQGGVSRRTAAQVRGEAGGRGLGEGGGKGMLGRGTVPGVWQDGDKAFAWMSCPCERESGVGVTVISRGCHASNAAPSQTPAVQCRRVPLTLSPSLPHPFPAAPSPSPRQPAFLC